MSFGDSHIKTDKDVNIKCFTGINGIEFAVSLIDNNAGWTPLKTGKSGTNKSDRKRNRKDRWR